MKQVILCLPIDLSKSLSKILIDNQCEIIRDLPHISRNSVSDFIALRPDIIIVSEYVAIDAGLNLLEVLLTLRREMSVQIIVHLSERKSGDRLLQKLVGGAIYDFIAATEFNLTDILELINKPRTFNDVSDYYQPALDQSDAPLKEMPHSPTIIKEKEIVEVIKEVISERETIKEVIKEIKVPVFSKGLKETTLFLGWENAGKSFIAVNYGTLLSTLGAKVALVDANEENYGLSAYFKIPDDHQGLNALIDNKAPEAIKYAAKPVRNLFIFTNTQPGREILTNEYALIQEKLREDIDVLLIDGSARISTFLKDVLFQVTKVIVVVTPNLPKILILREQIEKWKKDGVNLSKFKAVLNQYVPSKIIDAKSVAELLGIKVISEVEPLYPLAFESQIHGEPALNLSPHDKLKEALLPLVDNIWGSKPHKSFLKKILAKKGW